MSHEIARIIQSFAIEEKTLPLTQAITVGGVRQRERKICYLALRDQMGQIGCGELSPLPGLHQESLEEAKQQLKRALHYLLHQPIGLDRQETFEQLAERSWYQLQDCYPSVQFCLEMAIDHYWMGRQNQALSLAHLPEEKRTKIPIQALLWGPTEEMKTQAHLRIEEGFTTFKIKVGRSEIDTEVACLKALSQELPASVVFRLDANRLWNLDEAIEFSEKVQGLSIDYIEEPLSEPNLLRQYKEHPSALPLALDESLVGLQTPLRLSKQLPQPKAFILKPQALGGRQDCQKWLDWAKQRTKIIFSSCFESNVGLAWIALFASECSMSSAMGLDTQRWFRVKEDKLIQNGAISSAQAHHILTTHIQQTNWNWKDAIG